jgi:ribosomal-protein-alanine N-acetyltransferase
MSSSEIFQPFPRLETPRFVLREMTEEDAPSIFEIFSNPDVMEYWSYPPYQSIDQAAELLRRISEGIRAGSAIEWGVTERGNEGRPIGKCGFHKWYKDHYRAEIGYAVARSHWGQRVMPEALRAILAFGFERMGLHSVEAQLYPENARSVRTLEGLGFVKEGHLRENFFAHGRFGDTLIYSLLAPSSHQGAGLPAARPETSSP